LTRTTSERLTGIAARLTEPQDRETYAALVSYFNSLPEGDELFRLVELLGLLSLVGQRLPDAMAELLAELRAQAKAAGEYHAQVDARLADLPAQIAEGVDPKAIAEQMSEVFRQRITGAGLRDVAAQLKTASADIKSLANDASASLKPAANEIRGITAAISTEVRKLVSAAREVEQHNARLMARERSNRWGLMALAALLLFLAGGLCGMFLETRQTAGILANIGAQIERVQTPAPLPIAATPRKNGKRAGL
jgi:hypothetical protein